jgi:hypothetical protein
VNSYERADLSDTGWDPSEPANDPPEDVVELEVDFVDHLDRKLACTVGWNEMDCEAEWVDCWDQEGVKVNVDFSTREEIVRKAVEG